MHGAVTERKGVGVGCFPILFMHPDAGVVDLLVEAVSPEVLQAILDHDDEQDQGQWHHGDFPVEHLQRGHPVQDHEEQEIDIRPSAEGKQGMSKNIPGVTDLFLAAISPDRPTCHSQAMTNRET